MSYEQSLSDSSQEGFESTDKIPFYEGLNISGAVVLLAAYGTYTVRDAVEGLAIYLNHFSLPLH